MKLEFLDRVSRNNHIQNWIKTCPAEAELFHEDGWTDMTKLIADFIILRRAPENKRKLNALCLCRT